MCMCVCVCVCVFVCVLCVCARVCVCVRVHARARAILQTLTIVSWGRPLDTYVRMQQNPCVILICQEKKFTCTRAYTNRCAILGADRPAGAVGAHASIWVQPYRIASFLLHRNSFRSPCPRMPACCCASRCLGTVNTGTRRVCTAKHVPSHVTLHAKACIACSQLRSDYTPPIICAHPEATHVA